MAIRESSEGPATLNLGAGEILLIAVAGLLLFGPNRLPEIARTVGKVVREFRRATNELSEELKSGLDLDSASDRKVEPLPERPGPRG